MRPCHYIKRGSIRALVPGCWPVVMYHSETNVMKRCTCKREGKTDGDKGNDNSVRCDEGRMVDGAA